MNMLKKSLIVGGSAILITIILAGAAFASVERCINAYYPNITTETDNPDYPVRCQTLKDGDDSIVIYAKKAADCVAVTEIAENKDRCASSSMPVDDTSYTPSYADGDKILDKIEQCIEKGEKYPGLSMQEDSDHIIKCPAVKYATNSYITLYAEKSADCASAATLASDPDSCVTTSSNTDTTDTTKKETAKKSTNNDATNIVVIIILIITLALGIAIIVIVAMQALGNKSK
jgi:hypothetical protein